MAKRLTNRFIEDYKRENLEDSFLTTYDNPLSKASSYYYDELENHEISQFPMACELVAKDGTIIRAVDLNKYSQKELKQARLRYYYLPYFHEIYLGTTGSGKTTGCIEPQIRALGKQKNKPNLFITDPKGELFDHHSRFLRDEGYNVYILNFKDVYHSNYLNFLDEPYEEFQKLKKLSLMAKKAVVKEGMPEEGEILGGEIERFDGKKYVLSEGMAFPAPEDLEMYLSAQEFNIKAKVSSLVADIASDMIPENPQDKDPTWANGARGLLKGIISLLLHVSIQDPSFKKEYFNLKTINDVYTLFNQGCLKEDNNERGAREVKMMREFLKYMEGDERHLIDNVITTHPSTRKGFFSVFESQMEKWMQAHIFQITSATNIDIEHDEEKPFVIFFATRDYAKGDFEVAGIFIDYVYRAALLKADNAPKDENNNPKTRTLHFLLDEFGNIPAIPSFQTKISTARSRKIFFHLFLQSYQQLSLVYGDLNSKIIVDNCNQEMFIGSQNFDTKETFSKKCGLHSVEDISSRLERRRTFERNPIIQISDLEELKPGEMYIKRFNSPVIKTTFIRSYILANLGFFNHYYDDKAIKEVAPTNYRGLQIDKISYKKIQLYNSKFLDLSLAPSLKDSFEDNPKKKVEVETKEEPKVEAPKEEVEKEEDEPFVVKKTVKEEAKPNIEGKKEEENNTLIDEFRKLLKESDEGDDEGGEDNE